MQPRTLFRLCVCLTFTHLLAAYNLSPGLGEFYCFMNGNYTDAEQVETSDENRSLLSVRFQPLLAPALSVIPVLYFEEFINKVEVRALILIIKEEEDGTIFSTPYNFSGNTGMQPDTFNTDVIKSFTWANLQGNPDCKQTFTRVDQFTVLLNWLDCKQAAVNGHRESYAIAVNCTTAAVVMHAGAAETPTLKPYRMKLRGKKYPLENAPDDYVCNCDKPPSNSENTSG